MSVMPYYGALECSGLTVISSPLAIPPIVVAVSRFPGWSKRITFRIQHPPLNNDVGESVSFSKLFPMALVALLPVLPMAAESTAEAFRSHSGTSYMAGQNSEDDTSWGD